MTTRAAALAGLAYFADVRAIARQVGVQVPSDGEIAARFAVTDAIDIDALTADSAMMSGVVRSVTGAVDTAYDAHGAMPDAWRGQAADAADAAVAAHVSAAYHSVDQMRVVSGAVAAAASALSRVEGEKHRTLATLTTDRIVGVPISTITADAVDSDADSVRREIGAAVDLFTRTMDTVDTAVSTILAVLAASFATLPAPSRTDPAVDHSAPAPAGSRTRRGRRPETVTPTVASFETVVPAPDSSVLIAAISATATLTGAALAAASAVGMAAAGGLGSVLSHLIDAVTESDSDENPDSVRNPDALGRDSWTAEDRTAQTDHGRSELAGAQGDAIRRGGPESTAPAVRLPDSTSSAPMGPTPSSPGVPERAPTRPEGTGAPSAVDPGDTDDVATTSGSRSQGVDARNLPSWGTRSRGAEPPRGRADPDDGGGLALAGDR